MPLPQELLDLLPPDLPAPRLSILSAKQKRIARYSVLVVVVPLMGLLSITKGWFAFVSVPLLLLVIPAVMWAQITTDLRLAKGSAHPSMPRLADIQLASAVAFYFALPMAGDGHPEIIYLVDAPWAVNLSLLLTFAAPVAFLFSSIRFFIVSRSEVLSAD